MNNYEKKLIKQYIIKANHYHTDSLTNIYGKIFENKILMKNISKILPDFYCLFIDHYVLNNIYFYDCNINESIVRCWKLKLQMIKLATHV